MKFFLKLKIPSKERAQCQNKIIVSYEFFKSLDMYVKCCENKNLNFKDKLKAKFPFSSFNKFHPFKLASNKRKPYANIKTFIVNTTYFIDCKIIYEDY